MKKTAIAPEHRPYLVVLILVLIGAGLLLATWRYVTTPADRGTAGDRLWDLEIRIHAKAAANETSAEIVLPIDTRYLRTVRQQIDHPGWKQRFRQKRESGDRSSKIVLLATRNGPLGSSASVTFSILQSALPLLTAGSQAKALDGEARERYLQDHPLLQIDHPGVRSVAERLQAKATAESALPDLIYAHVRQLKWRKGEDLQEVPDVLAAGTANPRERAYTMVALCRAAAIPARLVRGFVLKEAPDARVHFWVEAYVENRWRPYDPVWGYSGEVPANYLPMVKGLGEVVAIHQAASYSIAYAIQNTEALLDVPDSTHRDWREILDLARLPLETRQMLATLMLFPFGVLLTAAILQLTGIRAFGVFAPTLIATSLSYIPWQMAIAELIVVLVFGVLGRMVMPGELPRAPRLAIVMTLVVVGMVASASLLDYFEINMGGGLALLPIIVLTSVVDRFYSTFDEQGLHVAVIRLAWTLALAVLCLPILQYQALGDALTRFPEVHLLTLAAALAISLYGGKQLVQLRAFAWLNGAKKRSAGKTA